MIKCKNIQLQLLACILLLLELLPLQVIDSINKVLGQGMKQTALRYKEKQTCSNGGEHMAMAAEGNSLVIQSRYKLRHSKEAEWIAEEYKLMVNDKQYMFKEHIPGVFCHLRAQFQIDNGKFYVSSESNLI
jgi:hypothetical protein